MTKVIQVRKVPLELHRRLKARAALEGVSMSGYVLRELRKSLETPSRSEILARARALSTRH
jgi:plasmid stability protein